MSFLQMQLSLMAGDKEVLFTEFDTEGSDTMNWFDPGHIISSSYTDLNDQVNFDFFSIKG